MFFEAAQINDILNCGNCNDKLDEPRISPCGTTICNSCAFAINRSINSKTREYKCNLCEEYHSLPTNGFTINKSIAKLLAKKPSEVYRSNMVETLKTHLNEIFTKKLDMEYCLKNSIVKIKEYCQNLRTDLDLYTEKVIIEINDRREEMLKEINAYELATIDSVTSKTEITNKFQETIEEIDHFYHRWTHYLMQLIIDDHEVSKSIKSALLLKKKISKEEVKLNSFIYNKQIIYLDTQSKDNNKNNFAMIRYKTLGSIDFNDCDLIELSLLITDKRFDSAEVEHCISSGNMFVVYLTPGRQLKSFTFDKDKKVIDKYIYANPGYTVQKFKKSNGFILVDLYCDSGFYYVQKLNYQLENIVIKRVSDYSYGNYSSYLLSANELNIYYFNVVYQLLVSDHQLNNQRADTCQNTNHTSPFYFPTNIRQLESRNGKIYWLNSNTFAVINEATGNLIRSVEMDANQFIFDSKENLIMFNKASSKLNYFDDNGLFLKEFECENFETEIFLFINQSDELMFLDKSSQKLYKSDVILSDA